MSGLDLPEVASSGVAARRASDEIPSASSLLGLLSWCTRPSSVTTLLIAVLVSALIPLIMALAPDVAINYTHHDMFIPMDAAWRTLQGQWPHTDFYTPLGLVYFWLHGAAAWLWGMDGRVIIRANLLALPFVLLPALILAWRRLDALLTILLALILTMLVTAPTFLDGPLRIIAELADYNRIGAAICAVVCIWALCPRRSAARWAVFVEPAMLGMLMLILLYLKVTFFALAVVIVAVGCLVDGRFWREAAGAAAVAIAGVVVLEIIHPGLMLSYLADIRRAGAANTQLMRPYYTLEAIVVNLEFCAIIGLLAAILFVVDRRQRRAVAGFLVVTASCVAVATQNFGALSVPLIVLVMLLAQRLAACFDAASMIRPLVQAVCLTLVVMATAPFLLTQAEGTIYQARMAPWKGVVLSQDAASPLHDVVWFPNIMEKEFIPPTYTMQEASTWDNPTLPALTVAAILTDGIGLLQQDGLTHRRIADLSFSNPFPVALKAPSPRGVALWWDKDRTFALGKLTADMVLGDADVVMVPKLWWYHYITTDLYDVASDKLQADFVPHESRYWTAWVKKAAPG